MISQVERLDMCDYQIVLTSIPLIIPYYAIILPLIWVNYNNLTATSLESWLIREMALIQVSEIS